jgi:hypothetical protein
LAVLQIVANNAGNAVQVSHAVRGVDFGNELVFALSMAPPQSARNSQVTAL